MPPTNTRYLVPQRGSPIIPTSGPKPAVTDPADVLIRLEAAAINPADIKMIDHGHRVAAWPLVPGLDGAGVVDAVGSAVTRFAPGDTVLALFATGDRAAAFQTFAVVPETNVAKTPPTWSSEEAASVGVCYMTAMVAIGIGLRTPLPFLPGGPTTGARPASVLVLGGSSALGAAAIRLLRLAVPGCMVLATSSPRHHVWITGALGADVAFDRASGALGAEVRAATPAGRGVDAILDAVGAGASDGSVFEALDPTGPKRYAQVWTGDDEIEAPEGVDSVLFRGRDLSRLQGGKNLMLALQALLGEGRYGLPLPVRKVGSGVNGLRKALDLMRSGVSGEKLVVTM